MTLEGKRFNDGVIDLSSLRKKKEEEKVQQFEFDAQAIVETIPPEFMAVNEKNEEVILTTLTALVMQNGIIYIVLSDNNPEDPAPFLMIANHENNAFVDGMRPPTEEEFTEYFAIMKGYEAEQEASEAEASEEEETPTE